MRKIISLLLTAALCLSLCACNEEPPAPVEETPEPTVTAAPAANNHAALANAALQELGYSPSEIAAAMKGVDPNASTEEMVRHALRAMVMKG